jgi:hypothetical protein
MIRQRAPGGKQKADGRCRNQAELEQKDTKENVSDFTFLPWKMARTAKYANHAKKAISFAYFACFAV